MTATDDAATRERLLAELPDIPRWLETRWMLSLGSTELTGLDRVGTASGEGGADPISFLMGLILTSGGSEAKEDGGFIVRDPPSGIVSVVGRPAAVAIQEAVARNESGGDVIAQVENADYVDEALSHRRERTTAKLHLLLDSEKMFGPSGPETNMFGLPEMDDGRGEFEIETERAEFLSNVEVTEVEGLSDELRRELTVAALRGPVVGVRVGGRHVSFCHAEVQTETLWDVSIETLEDHRRQGYAEKAVAHLAEHMLHERNKRPMWGALETNDASLRLAAKLGFRPVDEVAVFERD